MKFDLSKLAEALNAEKHISLVGISEETYYKVVEALRDGVFLPLEGYSYKDDVELGDWPGIKRMGKGIGCTPCIKPDKHGLHIKDFIVVEDNPIKKSMLNLLNSCISMVENDEISNLTDLKRALFGEDEEI